MSDDEAEAALLALAHELVSDLAAARVLELTGGLAAPAGAPEQADRLRQADGQWQPPPPGPGSGWGHTLRNPAHRGHLLGSDPFMNELYGRSAGPGRYAAQEAAGGPQEAAEGPPEGTEGQPSSEGELRARGMYEAARGATEAGSDVPLQRPQLPEAAPQRPARPPRGRYGSRRRLKYEGRR